MSSRRCKKTQCKCKCRKVDDLEAANAHDSQLVVGINGFGRIGRLVARCCFDKGIRVAQINEPFMEADYIAYNLVHDSVHGKFGKDVSVQEHNILVVDKEKILISDKREPAQIEWKDVNIVIEATGVFTSIESAKLHKNLDVSDAIKAVIITAPSADAPMFVMGVNHKEYNKEMFVVSNASCTTNCLAPLAKIVNDEYGLEEGLMTTIHSYTATQKTVDGPSMKDWRGGRAGSLNIIPSSTGAAKAVGFIIPELKGKLTGMALRVPTADVSVVDLTIKIKNKAKYSDIIDTLKQYAQKDEWKDLISVCEDSVVSRDFVGDTKSCIVDATAGIELNDTFMKFVAWYDNEFGYSQRVVDLAQYIHSVKN